MNVEVESSPREVVMRAVEAVGRGEVDGVARELHDDVVWDVVGATYMPRHHFEGKDAAIHDFLEETASPLFDFSVAPTLNVTGVAADGPTVVIEWTFAARSAKGRDYENSYCVVFEVTDGLISAVREYCNNEVAKRVLFD
jgi:ketosteroid isomerase-like protein